MSTTSPGPCPDPAVLAALADGTLDDRARQSTADHVANCDACVEDIGALVRLSREPVPELPPRLRAAVSDSRPRAPLSWRPLAALAATLVVSLGAWQFYARSELSPARPEGLSDNVVRSTPAGAAAPLLVRPVADERIRTGDLTIEWQATSSAIAYRVRVLHDDGQLVWERETRETVIVLPATTPLPRSVPLYVVVTAVLPDAKTTRAPAVRFEIAPE